jgi:hypothetical protein
MVADNATEVVPGTISRTLKNADANPVRASTPTDANWLYPCTATNAPVVIVRKPTMATVPPTTASAPVPKPIWAINRSNSVR